MRSHSLFLAAVAAATLIATRPAASRPSPQHAAGSADRATGVEVLAAAERAFAALSVKVGYLPAFLAYFSDEVVTFGPVPGRGKESLRAAAAVFMDHLEASPTPGPVARA